MDGGKKVNIRRGRVVLNIKESLCSKMKGLEDGYVSNVHYSESNGNDDALAMQTVHANNIINVHSGWWAQQIEN